MSASEAGVPLQAGHSFVVLDPFLSPHSKIFHLDALRTPAIKIALLALAVTIGAGQRCSVLARLQVGPDVLAAADEPYRFPYRFLYRFFAYMVAANE